MNNKFILELKDINVFFAPNIQSVKDVSLSVERNKITSVIGAKECGKTSLLRSINRLHELYPNIKVTGEILFNGRNLFKLNTIEVRKRIGMVFKTPSPFPNLSIAENVLVAYDINKVYLSKSEKEEKIQKYLTDIGLWDEVKNVLRENPSILTVSQQQLLCIARTLAIEPEVILMDEPTFTLDSEHATKLENLMFQLKSKCSILLASRNLSQAARISDFTLFMENGEGVEYGATSELFWNPKDKRTENFINIQIH
jgi:ABC-type phosphate transport system, ATPase component